MAELYAIRSAFRLLVTYGWQNVVIESDSKVAISLACAKVVHLELVMQLVADNQKCGIPIWLPLYSMG
ncbi:ribonuclease H protein [Tanacetum coccineum]